MRALSSILMVALAAGLGLATFAAADARPKRHAKPAPVAAVAHKSGTAVHPTYGISDIMREEPPTRRRVTPSVSRDLPPARVERPVRVPRGSSTYIPPPVPYPNSPNSPPSPVLLQPSAQPPAIPPINSFGDRVTNCIHSAPFAVGVGNNPANRDAYVRQCAN